MINDTLEMKGHVRIYKDGKLVQEADNTITNVGKGLMLDLLGNNSSTRCTYFEVGAGGCENLDVNNTSGTVSGIAFGMDTVYEQLGQTFYPSTGTISRIAIKTLTTSGTNNNEMICQLFHTSGTQEADPAGSVIPTGTAITSQYCRASYWNSPGSEMDFEINTSVTVGSRYAIVLRNSGTTVDDSNYFNVGYFTDETYTSGNCVKAHEDTWTLISGADLWFKVYYANSDGSPNGKTVSTSGLLIPTLEKAITSNTRSGTNITFVCDLTSLEANIPGRLSEARLITGAAGSTIAAVAFRDEDKTEESEIQLNWDITLV